MTDRALVQALFDDWYQDRVDIIHEFSGSISVDRLKHHRAATERAAALGINPPPDLDEWLVELAEEQMQQK